MKCKISDISFHIFSKTFNTYFVRTLGVHIHVFNVIPVELSTTLCIVTLPNKATLSNTQQNGEAVINHECTPPPPS